MCIRDSPYTGRFGVLSDEDKKAVDEAMELVNVSQIKEDVYKRQVGHSDLLLSIIQLSGRIII